MKIILRTLFLVFFLLSATVSNAQNWSIENLLQISRTQKNWPYVWLNQLDLKQKSYSTPWDSLKAEYQRLFLKGVGYFFIVPSYASTRDWNPRIQILEKVIDNWKEALKTLKQLEKEDPMQKNRWSYEYNTLKNARTAVFNRYLTEKKTRHYQKQSFFYLFDFSNSQARSKPGESFIQTVVIYFKKTALEPSP